MSVSFTWGFGVSGKTRENACQNVPFLGIVPATGVKIEDSLSLYIKLGFWWFWYKTPARVADSVVMGNVENSTFVRRNMLFFTVVRAFACQKRVTGMPEIS